MSLIYCHINLFDYQQNVYIIKDNGDREMIGKAPTAEISKLIAAASAEHHIYNIKLYGAEEEYVKDIATDIIVISSLDYNNDTNPLKIEVNNNEIFN